MKLKIFQTCGDCHQVAIAVKCAIMVMLLFCTISIAGAAGEPDPKPTITPEDTVATIPAVSFNKILSEAYKMLSGWFKQIVVIMVIAGGIYYMFGRSEEAKAAGMLHLKRPVEAVIAVIVILWLINWLYTL